MIARDPEIVEQQERPLKQREICDPTPLSPEPDADPEQGEEEAEVRRLFAQSRASVASMADQIFPTR
jgi:hypothetical protein